jgi:type I restriction enzyme S subunit
MNDSPDYVLAKIEEIPTDWKVARLEEFCLKITDRDHRTPKYADNGFPLVAPENFLGTNQIDFESCARIPREELERDRKKCDPINGDILFSRIGTVGLVRKVQTDRLFSVLHSIALLRPDTARVNPDFLFYWLQGSIVQKCARIAVQSGGTPDIGIQKIRDFPLVLPPQREQEKISSILSTVDGAIEKTEEIITMTQQLKKGLMQQLLTKGIGHTKFKQTEIGEIPEEWRVARLSDLTDVLNGRFFPSEHYTNTGIKLLRPGNLHQDGYVEWNQVNTKYLPVEYASSAKEWIVHGNEIVINLTAQSLEEEFLGRVCITGKDEYCLLNQRIARIHPLNIDAGYLFWVMKSKVFRRLVDRLPGGTKIKHIYTRELLTFKIPLAPLTEQRRIANILFDVSQKTAYEKDALRRLRTLKKGLMQELLTGKVRVKVN